MFGLDEPSVYDDPYSHQHGHGDGESDDPMTPSHDARGPDRAKDRTRLPRIIRFPVWASAETPSSIVWASICSSTVLMWSSETP